MEAFLLHQHSQRLESHQPLGLPDESLGRPLAVSRGLDGPAAYGAPLSTAVPDDPFGLRSNITPATSGPSLTVARPAVTGLEPQQVSLEALLWFSLKAGATW